MKPPFTLIYSEPEHQLQHIPGVPPGFVHDLSFCKAHWLRLPEGIVTVQDFAGSDYCIWQWYFRLQQSLNCYVEAVDGNIVLLQSVALQNGSMTVCKETLYLLPKMYTVLYLPKGMHRLVLQSTSCQLIFFRPPLSFLEGLKNEVPGMSKLVEYFLQQQQQPLFLPVIPMLQDGWMRLKKLDTAALQNSIPDIQLRRYMLDVLQDYGKTGREQTASQLVFVSTRQKSILLKTFLDQNLFDPSLPSLAELAKRYYVERRALSKAFVQLTGKSIPHYILELRLRQAHTYIKETELPVMEICFRCGFNDVSHFIRSFKRNFGITPGQMRKK